MRGPDVKKSTLDWPALMRAGIQGLGLHPDAFWQLTPAQLQMMLGDAFQDKPLLRGGLDALMQVYPDRSERDMKDE